MGKTQPVTEERVWLICLGMETIAQEMGIKVDRTEAPSYDMFEL